MEQIDTLQGKERKPEEEHEVMRRGHKERR